MNDDGLLLNFAAPAVASTSKKQQRRRNDGSEAATGKSTASRIKQVSSAIKPNTPSKAPARNINATSIAHHNGQEQRKSTSRATKSDENDRALAESSSRSQSTTRAAPKNGKARGTAVISSLFSGSDALQEERLSSAKQKALVTFDPTNAPSKAFNFASLKLDPLLVAHLASDKMKIKRPTGIQRTALPFLISPTSLQRDALLHAQTGSGKTLCYLLPIMQSLLPFCEASWVDRSCLGTLAIILAPTRELARQIYEVAEAICSLYLGDSARPEKHADGSEEIEADAEQPSYTGTRRTRWIVPGLLSGGATKNHEKSRIRKGLPLVVATPGRLLDHLRNTASLDVGRLQWLVLDEADRLLQLGFEETLNDILKAIDGRRRAACDVQRQRMRDELGNQYSGEKIDDASVTDTFGEQWWKYERRTVLCSATLDEGVQMLAGKSLRQPKVIRADVENREDDKDNLEDQEDGHAAPSRISAPAQLVQNYTIVPTKQRLILLVALIRRAIAASASAKVMVFLSCTDSVDFHLAALRGVQMARDATYDEEADGRDSLEFHSQLFPSTSLFKLHGSLTAHVRQASLKAFTQCKQAAVLFCTSVASRGLDLHVSHVIQVDPPTEKGADEYVHRVGRTARAGQQGESWLMVLPSEEACVAHYERGMRHSSDSGTHTASNDADILRKNDVASVLQDGFGGTDLVQTQTRATDAQMALERWTSGREEHAMLARRAYLSHLRAYATHPPNERNMFAVGSLQLGHMAKAFALREAPAEIRNKVRQHQSKTMTASSNTKVASDVVASLQAAKKRKRSIGSDASDENGSDDDEAHDILDGRSGGGEKLQFQRNEETEARMYAKVRQLGKLHKRAGVMGEHGGADEFQIA